MTLGGIIFWVRMREEGIEIKVSDGKNAGRMFFVDQGLKVSDNNPNLIGLFRTLYSGILKNVVIQYK